MRLVTDANVLLAAVLGSRAKTVPQHPEIDELVTAEATLAETQEYAIIFARKRRLSLDTLLLAVATLPVTVAQQAVYAAALPQARKLIAQRDPDAVDVLALTIYSGLPLWSKNNDFEDTGIEWYRTAELLQKPGGRNRTGDESLQRQAMWISGGWKFGSRLTAWRGPLSISSRRSAALKIS